MPPVAARWARRRIEVFRLQTALYSLQMKNEKALGLRARAGRVGGLALALALCAALFSPSAPARAARGAVADPPHGPHAQEERAHAPGAPRLPAANTTIRPLVSEKVAGRPSSIAPRGLAVAAAAPSPTREVFGFAPYWALPDAGRWNYGLLSTIAYFGLDLNADGSIATNTQGWTGWNSQALVDLINRAHSAGVRVVLVVKAFDNATINSIVTDRAATQAAIRNTMDAVAAKQLDGVNVDFEGSTSPAFPSLQTGMTGFMASLSSQVHSRWPRAHVSIDTYSGSASWDGGLFRIDALAPYVDAFFVMAYDMAFANAPGRAAPNAPLNGWTYNDTQLVREYLVKAPAGKIVLGVPYYGYKWSTTGNQPYAPVTGGATARTYAGVLEDLACANGLTRSWDATAQSPWASWLSPASGDPCEANFNSWRELYYDDARSLGLKYDLVNSMGLRGAGMWALGYDGASPDLWAALQTAFLPTPPPPPPPAYPAMYSLDGWGGLHPMGATPAVRTSAYWLNWKIARAAALLPSAAGGYVLDGWGGLHEFGEAAPVKAGAYWPFWDIARDLVLLPNSPGGYTLDGWGGLHEFGGAAPARTSAYWPFWDIANRMALLSDGSGGYVLDRWGGLHPFAVGAAAMPPAISNNAYWKFWDIARGVALTPGSTAGNVSGVTLDGWGGLHPFGNAGTASGSAYWPAWDIARAVRLSATSTPARPAGWVVDGWGGMHEFGGAPAVSTSAYWKHWDIAVDLLVP